MSERTKTIMIAGGFLAIAVFIMLFAIGTGIHSSNWPLAAAYAAVAIMNVWFVIRFVRGRRP